jgi:hypothetical protein
LLTKGIIGTNESVVHWLDLRSITEKLLENDKLTTDETRTTEGPFTYPYIFATSDRLTGAFYACRQNSERTPVLITFEADVSDLLIDPRDFLATIFQSPTNEITYAKQKEILSKMYGEAILPYFEQAKNKSHLNQKLAY